MKFLRHSLYLTVLVGALGLASCSFIFDFTECSVDEDCRSFDNPQEAEFFVCSADNKCVLEPERRCREDAHCDGSQVCQQAEGTCVQPS